MTKRNFLSLFLLFVLVTALAVISLVKLERENDALNDSASNLSMPSLNPDQVRTIEISWLDQKTTLKFIGDYWCVAERDNAQALTAQIAELLDGIAKSAPLKELQMNEELLGDLNLSDTPDENNRKTGILLVLRDAEGKELYRMMLGRGHEKLSQERIGNYAVQGYDGRYVRVWEPGGKQHVYLISRVFEKCSTNPRTWLEPLYLSKPESPLYVRFLRKDESGKYKASWMVSAASTGFQLILPIGMKLSVQELSRKVSLLAAPFSQDRADDVADLRFESAIQLVMADGFSYLIELAQEEQKLYAKMTVSFAEAQMKQAKTETAEEFARRKRYLLARFEYEKRVANDHVFSVRSDLLEQFSQPPAEQKATVSAEKTATSATKTFLNSTSPKK